MDYPVVALPPTMSTSDSDFIRKNAAFAAYSPYDQFVCSNYFSCDSTTQAWLLRQYTVTPDSDSTDPNTPPDYSPSLDLARSATATASTGAPYQGADKTIDGLFGGVSWKSDFGQLKICQS
jgi:hypothetical protein